ncbi:MAG: UbiA family prenyltransferase [Deltaproteobacteria bacterium]|nr:UbiA family prenyltransferase [Deltaproteobacteria bacterium]MBK8716999.1 UbiA family prenyltransferase [Deltaproteobacteria bacterium]
MRSTTPLLTVAQATMQLSVLLSLGGASVAVAAAFAAGGSPAPSGVIAVFASVFAVYNFDRLADTSPAEGRSTPQRRALTQRWGSVLRVCVATSAALALALGASVSLAAFAWTIAFPLLGMLYVLPLRASGRVYRLKDVPYLKPFYVCACWTELLAVSLSHAGLDATPAIATFAAFLYPRLFISANLGDVRDVEDDAAAGIRSLPQWLGRSATLRLLEFVHWASVAGLVLALAAGFAPPAMLGLIVPTAVAYAIFRAYVRRPDRQAFFTDLYDLELILYAPSWAIAAAMTTA